MSEPPIYDRRCEHGFRERECVWPMCSWAYKSEPGSSAGGSRQDDNGSSGHGSVGERQGRQPGSELPQGVNENTACGHRIAVESRGVGIIQECALPAGHDGDHTAVIPVPVEVTTLALLEAASESLADQSGMVVCWHEYRNMQALLAGGCPQCLVDKALALLQREEAIRGL